MLGKQKFYSLKNIKEKKATYSIIFGERSNGKSFAAFDEALKLYLDTGRQLALIRRYKEDFRGKRGQQMFANLECDGNGVNRIKKYSQGRYDCIYYYSGRWYLGSHDPDTEKIIYNDEPFAYGFSLADMEHDKSTSYPKVGIIVFDEFMTRKGYLQDEFVLFMNVISSIVRYRDDIPIYLLGNTVNKYCPYFTEMGLKHISKMKKGDIDLYSYGDSGLTVAVEYSDSPNKAGKPSDKYFAFDNPKISMITGGAWEVAMYPHCPFKYLGKEIIYNYFIKFDGELLHAEIIRHNKDYITYIHRKTTPIKDEDKAIIYEPVIRPERNYCYKITKPVLPIHKKILWFFAADKVFYQDNEVGEIVNNYLNWCKSN